MGLKKGNAYKWPIALPEKAFAKKCFAHDYARAKKGRLFTKA